MKDMNRCYQCEELQDEISALKTIKYVIDVVRSNGADFAEFYNLTPDKQADAWKKFNKPEQTRGIKE